MEFLIWSTPFPKIVVFVLIFSTLFSCPNVNGIILLKIVAKALTDNVARAKPPKISIPGIDVMNSNNVLTTTNAGFKNFNVLDPTFIKKLPAI